MLSTKIVHRAVTFSWSMHSTLPIVFYFLFVENMGKEPSFTSIEQSSINTTANLYQTRSIDKTMLISCIVPIMSPGTPGKRDCWLRINQRSSNTVLISLLGNLTMSLHRIHRYKSMLIYCVIGKTITTTALQWGSATSVSIYTISGGLKEKIHDLYVQYQFAFNKSLQS